MPVDSRVDSGCCLSQMQETGSLQLGSVVSQRPRNWGGVEVKFQGAKGGGYFLRVPFYPEAQGSGQAQYRQAVNDNIRMAFVASFSLLFVTGQPKSLTFTLTCPGHLPCSFFRLVCGQPCPICEYFLFSCFFLLFSESGNCVAKLFKTLQCR